MTQLALDLSARDRAVSPADTATLERALAGSGWLTAAQLAPALGWTDRKVRAVASSAPELFVSWPGSPGYKLLRECTREEFDHFSRATLAQADEMRARVVRAQRAWFAKGPL